MNEPIVPFEQRPTERITKPGISILSVGGKTAAEGFMLVGNAGLSKAWSAAEEAAYWAEVNSAAEADHVALMIERTRRETELKADSFLSGMLVGIVCGGLAVGLLVKALA